MSSAQTVIVGTQLRKTPCLLIVAFVWTHVVTASADPPAASYIFPAGGQRGATVHTRVGATSVHGRAHFQMMGQGVSAPTEIEEIDTIRFEGPTVFKPDSKKPEDYPRDHAATIRIEPDARLGYRPWQLWTSQGVTPSRLFVVGDLPEMIEEEIDGQPIPTEVSLPVTINGRIFPREDIDIWLVEAAAGQSITCEVLASRIGSPLDSRLEVRSPGGQKLAENTDHFGPDSFVRFVAPESGIYEIHIHDIRFLGLQDYVYRLTVTSGAYVEHVFPLGGQRGGDVAFQLVGQGVPRDLLTVQLPRVDMPLIRHQFAANTKTSNPVLLGLSDYAEHTEDCLRESSSTVESPLQVPCTLNGRIDVPGEVDRWPVQLLAGSTYDLLVQSATFGSKLDAILCVADGAGNVQLTAASTLENPIEPRVSFQPPASGTYWVEIRDVMPERAGPAFGYRATIASPRAPGFELMLATDAVSVFRGATSSIGVQVTRSGDFDQPIVVSLEGLPRGVTAENVTINPDKNTATVAIKANENARIQAVPVKLIGRVEHLGMTESATHSASTMTDKRSDFQLAVCMPTPFKLAGDGFSSDYAARGTVLRRWFVLDQGGYEGPLNIRLADRQVRHLQGVTGETLELDSDVEGRFQYSIRVPNNLEMARIGRVVIAGVGEVDDEEGRKHTVSFSSPSSNDQIILLTAPCPMGLKVRPESIVANAETGGSVRAEVLRGELPRNPVKVELVVPRHIKGVSASSITIAANESSGILKLEFAPSCGPFNMPLSIAASMLDEHGDTVHIQRALDVVGHAHDGRRFVVK